MKDLLSFSLLVFPVAALWAMKEATCQIETNDGTYQQICVVSKLKLKKLSM
jgi:hypothetical protein